jgi:Lon protease-like protein
MIKNIALLVDPVAYALRIAETEAEKKTWTNLYPVFYYNSTIFPGSHLNLHLFEPRYKVMMQRVVNSTRSFAYVPNFSNYTASIGDICLIAELKECEFLADGRCILDAVMTVRNKITQHFVEEGTQGLSFVKVEPFSDVKVEDPVELAALNELRVEAVAVVDDFMGLVAVRRHIEEQYGPAPTNNVEQFSLCL